MVVAAEVVQAPNDKQQIEPMLDKIDGLAGRTGQPETLLADNGYFSGANVTACETAGIEPLIATRPTAASSVAARAVRRGAAGAGEPDAGRGHGAPAENARRQEALCAAQADARNRCSASSNR